jgi:hypothetical protein
MGADLGIYPDKCNDEQIALVMAFVIINKAAHLLLGAGASPSTEKKDYGG